MTDPTPNAADLWHLSLTDQERVDVLRAIHLAQDQLAEAADAIEDLTYKKLLDKQLDRLDDVRRRLGDLWEKLPEYTCPDTPAELFE
jgi:hypothetical protein